MIKLSFRTYGPMTYFPLRDIIEGEVSKSGISEGLATIHARGATPAILVVRRDELSLIDEFLKRLVPVAGWLHGNAYAHLRSTIASTVKTLIIDGGKLAIPETYEIYFLETRPVHNHERSIHIYLRGY